jgi:outer membrane protein
VLYRFSLPRILILAFVVTAAASAQSPRAITLEEAVRLARTQSASVQQAELEVDVRQAALGQARGQWWPAVEFSTGGSQRHGLSFDQTAGQLTQETTQGADAGLYGSWVVFDGFARQGRIAGAHSERQAAMLRRARAEQAAVHDALSFFFDVSTAGATLEVVEANLEAQERQLDVVEAQVDAGIRPPSEVFLQQERLAEAEMRVLDARRTLQSAQLRLARLLGLDPTLPYEFVAPDPEPTGDTTPAAQAVDQALGRRPDVRAYGAAVAAAAAQVRVARAGVWPTLTLSGNYTTQYSSLRPLDFTDQLDANRAGAFGFRIGIPLFDRGLRSAAARTADARLRQIEIEAEDRRREVAVEVLEAAQQLEVRTQEVVVAERRAVAANAFLEAERDRYQHGVTTLAAVAEASARQVDAEVGRARARYALAVTEVLLQFRMGSLEW